MKVNNHHPYAYIERGRELVAAAQRVSDILTDQVVLGSRAGLADALDTLNDCAATINAQADNRLTETSV